MMPKFSFCPDDIRRGFALVKLIRPMTGDYVLRIAGKTLSVISYDRRRFCRADIRALSSDTEDDYVSDEFFLSVDRQTLFDAKLSSMSISVGDKGLNIRASEEGQNRSAVIRRRPDNSRRPKIISRELPSGGVLTQAKSFEDLLHKVSCAALIRETKTDEDMKINQIHFYPEKECVTSNARTYASAAFLSGLNLDLSIVSADIPMIRTFCMKIKSEQINIGQNASHLFLSDPDTGSYLILSRVVTAKPPLFLVSENDYLVEFEVERTKLVSSLSWTKTAIEGTSRINIAAVCSSENNSGTLSISSNGQEMASIQVKFRKGKELRSDFHVPTLFSIISAVDDDIILLRYSHPKIPTLLEMTSIQPSIVSARHFLQCMRTH
jgi:hypothetical protein